MTPEERRAAVRDLIGQGFKDDEILGAIEKRARAKPKAEPEFDAAGQVVDPGFGKRLRRVIGIGDGAAEPGFQDKYVDELRSGKRQPNFLQRAFPPKKSAEDPIQSDPLAEMIIGGIAGGGAQKLAAPLGRIIAGGVGGEVGNVASGGDPISGGLIGAGTAAIPIVGSGAGRLAGKAGRAVATKLRESPYPRGLDLRVQAEHGVEPTLFGQKDPRGAMPDPKKYAPTDSGRGTLGENNATELDRRSFLAEQRTKTDLDADKLKALRRDGELEFNSEGPTTAIDNSLDDASYLTGTAENLRAVRKALITPQGSKENVNSLLSGAESRSYRAKTMAKRSAAGGEHADPALIQRLEGEASDMRARARLAAQEGEYSELDRTTVRKADQARDKADHYANEELRMRPTSKQEFPFQQASAAIKEELERVSPGLRRANQKYSQRMGGTERDASGNEISRGIQGAQDLIKAQGPETYGTKLKSIGEDTGTGGAKLARHNRLKEVYESDIDPLVEGLRPTDPTSRLLLSQPQLLLARQRQSFLGKKPAALPSGGNTGIPAQMLRQVTSLGEPFLNRIVYPQALRLGRLGAGRAGPGSPLDVVPSLLLSRKDREDGRR